MNASIVYRLVVLWMISIILGCSSDSKEISPDVEPDQSLVEVITPTGNEKYLNLKSDVLFDQSKLHRFDITVPASALARIDADPSAEEYVEGSVTYDGETLSPVGIRYKGSIGAFVNCLSGTDWNNPSGFKTCTKLSMKIKVNWQDSDDKFYDVKKIQLHSQNLDKSQMHERLGYWLFAQMGVPGPRSVHAKLYINGTFQGVFALTEQIDGRLMREQFDDGRGNLYKEVWPIDFRGNVQSDNTYLEALKTNEDENPTTRIIKSFAQEMVDANPSEVKSVLNKWMDMDKTLAMAAVDRTIRHDDGPFHWYCSPGGCENHNYYWYEETSAEKLHLIPWDLDNAFENIRFNQNPVTPVKDAWGEITDDCNNFNFGMLNFSQRSASCDKIMRGWTLFDTEYEAKLDYLKNTLLEETSVNAMLDNWVAQIASATMEASSSHEDALAMSEWETAVRDLKLSLEWARTH